MPGALARTHSLAWEIKKPHEHSHHRSSRITGIPRANGFNGFLRALPGVHDVLVTVACRFHQQAWHQPRGARTTRLRRPHRHRSSGDIYASIASRPTFRDDRPERPSLGDGTRRTFRYDLPDKQSGIFLRKGLDDPNQVELPDEISFCAHAIFKSARARLGR
jgi:hypothetical protein